MVNRLGYVPTSLCVALLAVTQVAARPIVSYDRSTQGTQTASAAETQALNAVKVAPTPDAKLTAAEEFLKKYPQSASRAEVLDSVAKSISGLKDATQAAALAEKAQPLYSSSDEQDIIKTVLLDAYAAANRPDDVFKVGGDLLTKDPENVQVLVQLTLTGADQVKHQNTKYATQSLQYGNKAIQLIEADKKPAKMTDALWASHKAVLPQLYQQTAILNLVTGNNKEAKERLTKATTLNGKDPYAYALLGFILNDEYTKAVPAFQAMPASPAKDAERKRLEASLDNVIDIYAHAVGLGTGHPEYQALLQQLVPDLTNYYKYRHNQTTEGLQQLIDKYKAQP